MVTADQPNSFTAASPNWHFRAFSWLDASAAHAVSGGFQSFYDYSALRARAAGAVSGGNQYFYDHSTLSASAANAVGSGTQIFYDAGRLNAAATYAVNGGTQDFYGRSRLDASIAYAVNAGNQYFRDTSALIASASNAISGGTQTFYNSSGLSASAANGVGGGTQTFYSSSGLSASAANGVSGGTQAFYDTSALYASASNAVSGGTQTFYNTSKLHASAVGVVSGGLQYFHDTSALDASVFGAVNKGRQTFYDSSMLQASARDAVSGGTQYFYDSSTLGASARDTVSGGFQYFNATSRLNASAAGAVSGGTQAFYDTSTLNASVAGAVSGGTQTFHNSSTLSASATYGVSVGYQNFYDTTVLKASAESAVSGGSQQFWNTSRLDASAAGAVSDGNQFFKDNASLHASAVNAVNGGLQYFSNSSTLDASVAGAVDYGVQSFYDTSTLNASAADAVSGGIQSFYNSSTLNVLAAGALTYGDQYFNDSSRLDASVANAVSRGTQTFYNTSRLDASAANAVSRGTQYFNDSSRLVASAASAVSGGYQNFWKTSMLNASAAGAVSGGIQPFYDSSTLNASAAHAVNGGIQSFHDTSALNASAAGAVSNGIQWFYNSSTLNVLAADALTTGTDIRFTNALGGPGGIFRLNGHDTVIGGINSVQSGAGIIANGGVGGSVLTVDTSLAGPSTFSGFMQDGGAGRLGLTLQAGQLSLTGTSIHTGGTTVLGGTLLVGDEAGRGVLGGDVLVGANGILGGSGRLAGSAIIDGKLAAGRSPGTLTIGGNLTFKTGSTAVIELDTPIKVGGNLTLNGTLSANVAASGYYQLFDYDGALTGNFMSETVTSSVGDFVVGSYDLQSTIAGEVSLSVLGGPPVLGGGPGPGAGQAMQFWDGTDGSGNNTVDGGAGRWSADGTNWTKQPGQAGLNSIWDASIGVFRGAPGTVAVTGTQAFDTLQFSTDGYRVQGDALAIGVVGGSTFNIDADVTTTIASAIIDGAGTALRKVGNGTLALTGTNTYTGGTTVSSGTLLVGTGTGGMLGGAIDLLTGAQLGGLGAIGTAGSAVTINAGANHTPGDGTSTGQQIVAGDYVNHGTLTIAGAPSGTSRVVVAGMVDITGATLDLLLSPGSAADWSIANGPFTIIDKQGAGAVTGSFGSVEDLNDLLFLNHSLDYAGGDGNDVTLAFRRNDEPFAELANTGNQHAVAQAIESLGSGNAVWDAIAASSDVDLVRASFQALSGEGIASGQASLVNTGLMLGTAVDGRLRSAFDAAGSAFAPVLAYGPGGPELAAPDTALTVAWGSAYGAWGSIDGDGNATGLDTTGGGFAAGIDGQLGDWRLGLLAGYGQSGFEAGDRASSGKSDNYTLGLYGGTQWGSLAVRSGLAASWHDIDTDRNVAFPGFTDQLAASYGARSILAFGELGYKIDLSNAITLEPFANLTHVHLSSDGFTETGGAAALTAAASDTDASFTTLGLRASTQFAMGTVLGTVHAMAGWRHGFGDLATTSTMAFASGSDSFTVTGAPSARDTALFEAGLDLALSDTTGIGLTYDGQFAKGTSSNTVSADFRVKF